MAWAPITVNLDPLDEIRRPLRFAECSGTVGGFAVGGTLAGLRLSAAIDCAAPKLYDANRALLGSGWDHHAFPIHRDDPAADVVTATVPYRGTGGGHDELADVIGYAGRIKAAALVLAVPPSVWADADAHGLINTMRDALNRMTVCKYRTTYVQVDDIACGGVLDSGPQCFAVLSQAPFGVERPEVTWLPTVWDAIGDLAEQRETWESEPIWLPPTWWSADLRTPEHAVDGCAPPDPQGNVMRTTSYMLPFKGFAREDGIRWTKHPTQNRHLTHRDGARLMGFPDAWRLREASGTSRIGALWGTGPTVSVARWLLHWVDRSLHGHPGTDTAGYTLSGPSVGRWTYAMSLTEPVVWHSLAKRQWGPDWRDRL